MKPQEEKPLIHVTDATNFGAGLYAGFRCGMGSEFDYALAGGTLAATSVLDGAHKWVASWRYDVVRLQGKEKWNRLDDLLHSPIKERVFGSFEFDTEIHPALEGAAQTGIAAVMGVVPVSIGVGIGYMAGSALRWCIDPYGP